MNIPEKTNSHKGRSTSTILEGLKEIRNLENNPDTFALRTTTTTQNWSIQEK